MFSEVGGVETIGRLLVILVLTLALLLIIFLMLTRRAMRREHAAEQIRVREMELAILRSKSLADSRLLEVTASPAGSGSAAC